MRFALYLIRVADGCAEIVDGDQVSHPSSNAGLV